MQAHNPVDPLPAIVRSTMQSGWYFSEGSLRSIIRPFRLSTSMFISSENRMVRHFSIDHDFTWLQKNFLAILWALVSMGFLAARFHLYPASCSLRRTVRELAGLPDVYSHCLEIRGDEAARFFGLDVWVCGLLLQLKFSFVHFLSYFWIVRLLLSVV